MQTQKLERRIDDPDTKNRFLKFVDNKNACHIWTGYRDKDGYGRFRLGPKKARANRVSYLLFCGDIPANMVVCHTCDVAGCVRPSHLFLGTNRDNVLDMWAKGRNGKHLFYVQKNKKFCMQGHEFSESNTYRWRGHRKCRICHRVRSMEYYKRRQNADAKT